MTKLDDFMEHADYCAVWVPHQNDDGEIQAGPCSCDVEAARAELAALRAELDHKRTLAMMALAMMEHLDTVNAPISEYESAWLVRTREITDAEQRRINAAEATRLLGLDQEPT